MNKSTNIKSKKPNKISAFFICLLIAGALWVLHSLNTVYTQDIKVAVSFKNIPEDKKNNIKLPDTVTLKLKASGLKLIFIAANKKNNRVELNFAQLKAREENRAYFLSSAKEYFLKNLGIKAEVKSIIPDTIYLSNSESSASLIPVKAVYKSPLSSGYIVRSVSIFPDKVYIKNNDRSMISIDSIQTELIDLSDFSESTEKNVRLIAEKGIILNPNTVQVRIVKEAYAEYLMKIPVTVEADNSELKPVPSHITIKVAGALSDLKALEKNTIKAFAKRTSLSQASASIEIKGLPKELNLISFEPKNVEFIVRNKK